VPGNPFRPPATGADTRQPTDKEDTLVDKDRVEGKKKETEGEIQQKWGEAKDKARDTWDDAKDKAEDMKDDRDREGEPASRNA